MDKTTVLEGIKLFVLDLDGTFYLGGQIFPYSLRFLERVKDSNRRFLFFTNNSSKSPELYLDKLNGMDVSITRDDIMTSGDVCIDYLKKHHSDASVYLMGTDALRQSFNSAGIRLAGEGASTDSTEIPDVVVCAFDTELTYEKLERACTSIRNGAVFLATHEDINCPTEDGFIPDCGAMCAAISLSTGKAPKYLGKPHKETVEKILSHTGLDLNEIAFIGDRLYTDVACGVNNGAKGFLVLSGETKNEDVSASPIKPDAIFSNLGEVADLL